MSVKEKNKLRYLQRYLFQINSISSNPIPFFMSIMRKHGTMVDAYFLKRFYLTTNPEVIRHIFQKNNKNYVKTNRTIDPVRDQIGNGLLTSEGAYWLKQRRSIQPGFHRKRLEDISITMVKEINTYMDEVLDVFAEKNEAFVLDKEMMHLAYRLVSKSLFGSEVADEKLKLMDRVISEGQEYTVDLIRRPYLKFWLRLNGKFKKNEENRRISQELIMGIINDRKKSSKPQNDLLQMLLETEYEDGSKMTDEQLLDESLVLYVAGHETTALALTWALYLISSHSDVEQQLHKSTLSNFSDKDPAFSDLRSMGYTTQVIDETIRMYPPAWLLDREAIEEDEVGGYKINKNQDIFCFTYGMHRNPEYWENPDSFDPDRFSEENKKKHVPHAYMPFGAGPRLCIGNNFAMMEMQLILSMFSKRYRFEVLNDQSIDVQPLITLRPRNGIKVKVHKR